jgi:hypothetical protein
MAITCCIDIDLQPCPRHDLGSKQVEAIEIDTHCDELSLRAAFKPRLEEASG